MKSKRPRRWIWGVLLAGLATLLFLAQPLALAAIDGYQRWISPRKGWRCAYAVHHEGSPSCSNYAEQAIEEEGLLTGLAMLQQRFRECEASQRTLHAVHVQSGGQSGNWNCTSNDCSACNTGGTCSCN